MKRKSLKLFACAAIMAMTLSVTACGGSDDAAPAAETEEAAEPETETEEAAEPEAGAEDAAEPEDAAEETTEPEAAPEAEAADTAAAASGDTLESLFSDPAVKAQFEEQLAAYEEQGLSAALDAKGNEMIMTIKVTDSSLMQDGMAELLEAALDSAASDFEAQAGAFDEALGEPGACTVSVRYLDPDDNVLAERSFTAQ